jgi:hypothetical protein
MEQEDMVSKQVFLHDASYMNMLRKTAARMPDKRELKQHSQRWTEFRNTNFVSNYSLHLAFHKTTTKYKMSATSTK